MPPDLTPEQIERLNAGALESEIDATLEDVDEVAEALAVHSIVSEERHEEIIEGVEECRNRLDTLSTQIQTAPAESPLLNQLMAELLSLKAEVMSLKSSMDQMRTTPLQSVSEPVPVEIVEVRESPVEPRVEESTVEPSEENAAPVTEPESTPKRRHRVL